MRIPDALIINHFQAAAIQAVIFSLVRSPVTAFRIKKANMSQQAHYLIFMNRGALCIMVEKMIIPRVSYVLTKWFFIAHFGGRSSGETLDALRKDSNYSPIFAARQ